MKMNYLAERLKIFAFIGSCVFFGTHLAPSIASAHDGTSIESEIKGSESKLLGSIELRPSYETGTGNYFAENVVELGYQFSHKFQLAYEQEIHHNVSIREQKPEHEGLGLHLETGTLKAHFHEVFSTQDETTSLSIEPRIQMPTSAEDRQKGFATAGAMAFKFRSALTNQLSISLIEAPTFFIYSKPGARMEDEFEANPSFQSQTQFAVNYSFLNNRLNFSLPVLLYFTRHSNYDPEADHNNAWTTFLGLAPQIEYEFVEGFSSGLAVITPNLLNAKVADHSVNHGRTSTVNQLFLRASL